MKEIANKLSVEKNIIVFNCSNGFIGRFKERNAIVFQTFHGESDGVSDEVCKERISVFVGSNMTGTEKLNPIVIGKSKEPRCFRGKESLPIIYRII